MKEFYIRFFDKESKYYDFTFQKFDSIVEAVACYEENCDDEEFGFVVAEEYKGDLA